MTTSQTLRFASTTITSLIGTSTSSSGDPDDDIPDPLTNPATSRIVKVTIACAIVVLGITGLITGFKASLASPKSHSDCRKLSGYIYCSCVQIAGLYRSHRETRRRRAIQTTLATGGQVPGWMTQETKKKWGGRKVKNAHKQVEWEGIAA